MKYREAMQEGEKILQEAGIVDAKNDAWLLLAMVCKVDHTYYYMHMEEELMPEQQDEYCVVIRKRAEHVPLQYITGEQEFMGLPFKVNSNVLIPRQDTETLVEEALKVIRPGMKVLDMCTGSGCILISILKNVLNVEGVGCDISKQALIVAKENAKLNNVVATFERSDLFDHVTETFDVIVSNPPYIRTEEIATLMPEVCQCEPVGAHEADSKVIRIFSKTLSDLAEGELLQLQKAQSGDTVEEDYLRIIYSKTASLFEASCVSAALSVGASDQTVDAMRSYAVALGRAFQIKDDILDYDGTESVGKPLGVDILEQKMTMPLLGALVNAGPQEDMRIRALVRDIVGHPEHRDEIVAFVKTNGGMEYASERLDFYVNQAVDALAVLSESFEKELLVKLARYTASREK